MATTAFVPSQAENCARGFAAGQKIFERYTLKRILGHGGMGEVWLARDEQLEQEVALKFVSETMLHDPEAVERLKRETRHCLQLTHPNIVRIYDFVQDSHSAAIAMEYVDGWSLWAMKVDKPHQCFTVEEITPWIERLCVALEYAHGEARIIHRDLKPANLMISAREQLKVADFGIARIIRGASAEGTNLPVIGTVGYMSPQQAMGNEPSVLDDVYTLGATIYELLTGTPPFNKGEVLAQVRELTPPGMTERLNELGIDDRFIPLVWEETVAACLMNDPARRPQSVKEVLRKLEGTALSPQPRSEVKPPATVPKRSSHKKTIWVFGVMFAAVLLAFVGWIIPNLFRNVAPAEKTTPSVTGPASSRSPVSNEPLEQLAPAGLIDASFNPQAGARGKIHCLEIQGDGKILAGGYFSQFNNVDRSGIARLNPDGSLDEGFAVSVQGAVHALAIQAGGKIIIAGDFGAVNGERCVKVARLNPDGSLDRAFNPGTGGNLEMRSVAVQSDNKIIVGGSFTTFNRLNGFLRIARLQADGSVDTRFNPKPSAVVSAIAIQPDGKIVIGGPFSFGNAPPTRIARLGADGSLDATFHAEANNTVNSVALQSDGKILMGGGFTAVNGRERNRIARLNSDGSVDDTFQPGKAIIGPIIKLALQENGQIVIAGTVVAANNLSRKGIARLNADGSMDTTFNPEPGFKDTVNDLAIQPDGKIVAVASITSTNGVLQYHVVRLHDRASKVDQSQKATFR